jgi:type II restriction/modification system DNA methylase subunit YeeA
MEEIFVLDSKGNILFKSEDFQLSSEEAKAILKAWREKDSALMFQDLRFAILKNDEIQLAAKNIVGGKGNVIGSVTKEGDYLIAHTRDEGLIVLEWSIFVNKVVWT